MARRHRRPDHKRRRRSGTRRSEPVQPTQELLAQRIRASGDPTVPADYPLDVLEAKGVIEPRQAEAGRLLAKARTRVFGPATLSVAARYRRLGVRGEQYHGGAPSTEEEVEKYVAAKQAYKAALDALRKAGQGALNIVMRLAVHLEHPNWQRPTALVTVEMAALKAGLLALADHYGLADQERNVA